MQRLEVVADASVSDWPQRTALTLLFCALIVAVLALMRRGWVRRAARQLDVVPLPAVPSPPTLAGGVAGRYLGATRTGDWLDRLVVHGLGVPSKARAVVSDQGIWILRSGAPDLFIAPSAVVQVRHDRAAAGRVLETNGVLVITWDHCGTLIDVGLRVADASGAESLRVAIAGVCQLSKTSSMPNSGDPA